MRTSRPQSSVPRRSKRSGSAIQVPATSSASAARRWTTPLQRDELRAVVDAADVALVGGGECGDGHAVGHRHRDDVGQVELALRVVRLQRRHPAGEQRGRRGQHAGVDLADRALLGCRVLLLDDGPHGAVADRGRCDPVPTGPAPRAVSSASRPPRASASSSCIAAAGHERNVAEGHDGDAAAGQRGQRDADGVAGAARRVLRDEHDVGRRDGLAHRVGAVADDDGDAIRAERARRGEHVREQRPPGERCSTLGSAECIRLPWPAARTTMWVADGGMGVRNVSVGRGAALRPGSTAAAGRRWPKGPFYGIGSRNRAGGGRARASADADKRAAGYRAAVRGSARAGYRPL